MIEPSTGMKVGERYIVESLERTHHFPGFFLDGKYYLGPELMTSIGWLEGNRFFYDELDPAGEPVFPDRLAGTVEDLTLVLADGARLQINQMNYTDDEEADTTPIDTLDERRTAAQALEDKALRAKRSVGGRSPLLIVAGAAVVISGILLALTRRSSRTTRKLR